MSVFGFDATGAVCRLTLVKIAYGYPTISASQRMQLHPSASSTRRLALSDLVCTSFVCDDVSEDARKNRKLCESRDPRAPRVNGNA